MKHKIKLQKIPAAFYHWCVFFLLIAFVISCCMALFVTILSETLGITMTESNISEAAKITFINVIFISLLFTLIDGIRRRIMVGNPTKRIINAAERIIQGDFSVRIAPMNGIYGYESFNRIIGCFNKMAEELSGIETLRTDFAANVSHELKTPLAVIQNYGTMLQTPDLNEKERMDYAKAITDACRRLANLITNILKLNKLENQQIYPSSQEYDLSEQICGCILQYEDIWEKNNIDIETEIQDAILINSDRELLELVWNNLLSNAFKFTESGGQVTVSLFADEQFAFVKIADTGCGISPEIGMRIFEKFYQGDTSHSTQGNGLGLALVKRVVDIMNGEISVDSVPGKGSTFTVKIRRNFNERLETDS